MKDHKGVWDAVERYRNSGRTEKGVDMNITKKWTAMVVFTRDFIGGDMRGYSGLYEQWQNNGIVKVVTVGRDQLPTQEQLSNLPLPHEMWANKCRIRQYALAMMPYIGEIREG